MLPLQQVTLLLCLTLRRTKSTFRTRILLYLSLKRLESCENVSFRCSVPEFFRLLGCYIPKDGRIRVRIFPCAGF